MNEEWRTHPGIPGYEVSSNGNIRRSIAGIKANVPEPILSKNSAGQAAYWIKPISVGAQIMLRADGLTKFFGT